MLCGGDSSGLVEVERVIGVATTVLTLLRHESKSHPSLLGVGLCERNLSLQIFRRILIAAHIARVFSGSAVVCDRGAVTGLVVRRHARWLVAWLSLDGCGCADTLGRGRRLHVCAGACERDIWSRALASVAGLMVMVAVSVSIAVLDAVAVIGS
jgi:hypothetical protein